MLELLQKEFEERRAYYRSQHRTVGCKVTHMIGIPLMVMSIPTLLFNRKMALQMQAGGLALQFIGHYVFEHNKPVLLETRDPLVLIAALQFCGEQWWLVLQGKGLEESCEEAEISV
ncbi:MAG TPA: DUF962 domain-containing protein [Oculatellaceae cyanobacterium]